MSLPLKLNFSDYDNFLTEPNYTTSAEAQDYFRNMDMLVEALIDVGLWQPETNYFNGHVVFSPNMPNGTEAVCVATNGGKSSNTEPSWGEVGGDNISDGTCFWKLRWKHWSKSVEEIADLTTGATNRLPNKAYAVGNVVYDRSNLSVALKCTTAGTTSNDELDISGSSVGDTVTDGTCVWQVASRLSDGLPIGFILPFGANEQPAGWLSCDGTAVSRTVYADLFAVIGTNFGAGDGSTTFNLPNLNNNSFIEGDDVVGIVKEAGLPDIVGIAYGSNASTAGAFFDIKDGAFFSRPGAGSATIPPFGGTTNDPNATLGFQASLSNPIYGNSLTVQPKSVTVKFCIKAYGAITNAGSVELEEMAKDYERIASSYLPLSGGTLSGGLDVHGFVRMLRSNTDMEGGEIQFQHSKSNNYAGIDLFDENGTIKLRLIDYGVVDGNTHVPFHFNFNTSDIGTSKGVVAQVESMQFGLNGWIKLTHGFQVCWGELSTSSGLVTFPRAFKDQYNYQVICIDRGSSMYKLGALQESGTAFRIYTPANCGVTYIAVGQGA